MNILRFIVSVILGSAPVLAPAGTAWVVYASLAGVPVWPMEPFFAICVALSLEINGYSVVDLLLTLIRYNDNKKRKTDPTAPTGWAWGLLGVYLLSVLALTVLIEVVPQLSAWRAVVFPIMSLCAFAVPVLRSKHNKMLKEIEEAVAKRAAHRAETVAVAPKRTKKKAHKPNATASHLCEFGCGAAYGTINARNAHMRFCKMRNSGT